MSFFKFHIFMIHIFYEYFKFHIFIVPYFFKNL